jgi:hypothetical protein
VVCNVGAVLFIYTIIGGEMNELSYIAIAFCLVLFFLGLSLGFGWKWSSLKRVFFDVPLRHSLNVSNEEQMKYIINALPSLTMQEKEVIVQQIFGRPVTIVKGLDKDGSSWIELAKPFTLTDESDFEFHHGDKLKEMTG